jgi:hypothetical protein
MVPWFQSLFARLKKREARQRASGTSVYAWGLGTFGNPVGLLDKAPSFEKSFILSNNYYKC